MSDEDSGEGEQFITIRVKVHIPGEYEYFGSWITSFGERATRSDVSNLRLLRLWANDELVYDAIGGFRKPEHAFRFYNGSSLQGAVQWGSESKPSAGLQLPNNLPPLLKGIIERAARSPNLFVKGAMGGGFKEEPEEDAFKTPLNIHYRDLICIFANQWPLKDYGNSVPALSAELQEVNGVNTHGYIQGAPAGYGGSYAADLAFFVLNSDADRLQAIDHTKNKVVSFAAFSETRISNRTKVRVVGTWEGDTLSPADESPVGYAGMPQAPNPPPPGGVMRPDLWVYALSEDNRTAVIQTDGQPTLKRVFDTLTGRVIDMLQAPKWHDTLSVKLTWGSQSWQYLIASVEGGLSIFEYVEGLSYSGTGNGLGFKINLGYIPVCLTRGLSADGKLEIYATHSGGIDRITLAAAMSGRPITTVEEGWKAPAGHTPYMCWASRSDKSIVALVLTNDLTRDGYAIKIGIDGTVIWQSADMKLPRHKSAHERTQEATGDIESGTLVFRDDFASVLGITYLNTDTGFFRTDLLSRDMFADGNAITTARVVWDSGTDTLFTNAGSYARINVPATAGMLLQDLLQAFAVRAGYAPEDIFFTGMSHMECIGYVVSGQISFGQIADQLAQLYGFNWTEQNGQLLFSYHYNANGAFNVGTKVPPLAIADLTEQPGSGNNSLSRNLEANYPSIMSLTYFNVNDEYNAGFQVYKRHKTPKPTHSSEDRADISLPIVLTNAQAAKLLQDMIYRIWSTRIGASIRLPPEYMVIDPGDSISYTVDDYEYVVTATTVIINGDNSVSLTLVEGRDAINVIQADTYEPVISAPVAPGRPVNGLLIDIPLTDPGQEAAGRYSVWAVMAGYSPNTFSGAILKIGDHPGYLQMAELFTPDDEGYISFVKSVTQPADIEFTELDTVTRIRVSRGNFDFSLFRDATLEQMLNNYNMCVMGVPGAWELFTFGKATIIDDDTVELSQLLRGRYGTEGFINTAGPGTYFSMAINWRQIAYRPEVASMGASIYYTAQSPAQPEWQVTTQVIRPEGNSRRPYAPMAITADRDPNGDIRIKWLPRNRYTNVPPMTLEEVENEWVLDEQLEKYELVIFDPVNGNVILQTTEGWPQYHLPVWEQESLGMSPDIDTLAIGLRQLGPNELPGFGRMDVVFIGGMAVNLSVTFEGGGLFDVNVVGTALPIDLGVTFELGGDFRANVPGDAISGPPGVMLKVSFDADAQFLANVEQSALVPTLSKTLALGGDFRAKLAAPVVIRPYPDIEVSAHGNSYVSSTTITLTLPDDIERGDYIYAIIHRYDTLSPLRASMPAGWDRIATVDATIQGSVMMLKRAEGGEGGTEVTFTFSAAAGMLGYAYRTRDIGDIYNIIAISDNGNGFDIKLPRQTVPKAGMGVIINFMNRQFNLQQIPDWHLEAGGLGKYHFMSTKLTTVDGESTGNHVVKMGANAMRSNGFIVIHNLPIAEGEKPGHRYWRWVPTTVTGTNINHLISELRFYGRGVEKRGVTPIGTDLAQAANAFDGNLDTRWSSPRNTGWLGWDFGEGNREELDQIGIRSTATNGQPVSMSLQYSDDLVNWVSVFIATGIQPAEYANGAEVIRGEGLPSLEPGDPGFPPESPIDEGTIGVPVGDIMPAIRWSGSGQQVGTGVLYIQGTVIRTGDLLIATVTGTAQVPGWTPLRAAVPGVDFRSFYRIAGAADDLVNSLQIPLAGGSNTLVTLTVISGANRESPIEATAHGSVLNDVQYTSANAPAVNSGGSHRLLVDLIASQHQSGSGTIAVPAGSTEYHRSPRPAGQIVGATKQINAAGPIPVRPYLLSSTASWVADSVLVKGYVAPADGHKYWRVFIENNNGDANYLVVGEIEFIDDPLMGDQTNGGTAFASSATPDNPPIGAFNDTVTTGNVTASGRYWSTPDRQVTNQFIGYEFAFKTKVTQMRMLCDRDAARAPKTMHVEYSDDGVTYTRDWSIPAQTGWAIGQWRTFVKP